MLFFADAVWACLDYTASEKCRFFIMKLDFFLDSGLISDKIILMTQKNESKGDTHQADSTPSAADYVKSARVQLRDGDKNQAYQTLREAMIHYPENAMVLSYYKPSDATTSRALYPILYLNLGRACAAAGRKKEAVDAYTKGLKHDKSHPELRKEMKALGIRKQPPVPFLSRSNPINKYLGKVLNRSDKAQSRTRNA
jgi:Tfp pilus assembly protein PilF